MDKSGKIVVNPQFEEVGDFAKGLAPARVGKLLGLRGYHRHNSPSIRNSTTPAAFAEDLARVNIAESLGLH